MSEDAAQEEGAEEQDSTDAAPEAPATQTAELQTETGSAGSHSGGTTGDNIGDDTVDWNHGATQGGGQ
jgi:hypothetical protein